MLRIGLINLATLFISVALCSTTQILPRPARSVDKTLVPGSTEVEVVDACIEKLNSLSTLTNDFGLTKRIAYVESRFGNLTSGASDVGGIWQITPDIQKTIRTPSSLLQLSNVLLEASSKFGTDIANMSNTNFSVPLRSTLAARLFIEINGSRNIPATVPDQAVWWATYYNPSQQASIFENNVTTYEISIICQVQKMYIWFLIDGSGSIGKRNFETTLQFVVDLTSEFPISSNGVRAGFSVYSSSHKIHSFFDEHNSNSSFSNLVLSSPYTGGGTRTGAAITEAVTSGFNESSGLRPLSEGVPRVLIVLTDGHSHDSVIQPAELPSELVRKNLATPRTPGPFKVILKVQLVYQIKRQTDTANVSLTMQPTSSGRKT